MKRLKLNKIFLGIAFIAIFFICIIPQNGISATNISTNSESQGYTQYLSDRWLYYRDIHLSSPTQSPNDEIRIILNQTNFQYNYLLTNGSMFTSNGSDIRFDDFNGHFFDYWIQIWNTTGNSIIWVKVPKTGTQSFRMLYGRPGIATTSNGENTFLMYDDFQSYTYNTDEWFSYKSPFSEITVSQGFLSISCLPPNATAQSAEFGFSDKTYNESVSSQPYWTNGHAALDLTESLNWSMIEVHWINDTTAIIYKDGVQIGTDNSLRNGTLGMEFYTSAECSINQTTYSAWLRSTASDLGQPGRIFLAKIRVVINENGTDLDVDWAAVGELSVNEVTATIGQQGDIPTVAGFNPFVMMITVLISSSVLAILIIRKKKLHIN